MGSLVRRPALLAALLLALAAFNVAAQPAPPTVQSLAPGLVARGSGEYRWFGLSIYEATLWATPPSGTAPDPDWSQPLALQLRYSRALRGADIASRSAEEINRLGQGSTAQREAWLQAMRRLFPDVQTGDRLAGLHLPGQGVRFFRNDSFLGDIADEAFSRAFFSIWLDAASSAPGLRQSLLGRAR